MPVEANLILAQSAQESDRGVSALGMGWQVRPVDPIAWALVLIVEASRDEIGIEHSATIELETEDGSPVADDLIDLLKVEFQFTPAGLEDEDLESPVVRGYAFNLLPVPLEPGVEYCFRLRVDGESRDHWTASFRTPPP